MSFLVLQRVLVQLHMQKFDSSASIPVQDHLDRPFRKVCYCTFQRLETRGRALNDAIPECSFRIQSELMECNMRANGVQVS